MPKKRPPRAITIRVTPELLRRIDERVSVESRNFGVTIARETFLRNLIAEKVRNS